MCVGQDVADGLVQHREQARKSSESRVVHHMVQRLSVFQTLGYDCVCSKVRLQHRSALSLNLLT